MWRLLAPFLYLLSLHQVSSRYHFDVLVYRATPGGIAAAISAAEMGSKVLLIEPSSHVGGMATEGGIGLRDGPDYMRSDPRSSQYQWGRRNAMHYGIDDGDSDGDGDGDSVIWQPDHFVGESNFLEMLDESGVELLLDTDFVEGPSGVRIDSSASAGSRRIDAILLENHTWVQASYFIDASYEGELMQAAGVDFTFGRESSNTYDEAWGGVTNFSAAQFQLSINPFGDDGQLLRYVNRGNNPASQLGQGDDNLMAYSYRVCLTKDPNISVAVTPPDGYHSADFEIARRLVVAERRLNISLSEPWLYLDYMGYGRIPDRMMKYDGCCGVGPVGIDVVGLAVGYANASRALRAKIAADHRYYVQGLLWFWRSDPLVPLSTRKRHLEYGLCGDEWKDNFHFPRQLYAREAARMVGDRVFTQNDRDSTCRHDSIAVGSWGLDVHEMQRIAVQTDEGWKVVNEGLRGDNQGGIFPFEIPYWVILPKREQVGNLAVLGTPSASHVAFSAIREEPTLWQLGQAAGTAAAIAVSTGVESLHDVTIGRLQEALIEQGGVVHWPPNRTCESSLILSRSANAIA
jgi:hypothetical protein